MANSSSFPVVPATLSGSGQIPSSRCAVDARKSLTRHCAAPLDHFAGYDKFFDAFLRGQGIHRVEQEFFQDHHQSTRADFALNCLSGDSLECVFGELEFDIIKIKLLLVLLYQSILWFGQNLNEGAFIQFMQYACNR